jgi:imidazolonepropionase-like amidohydrolase
VQGKPLALALMLLAGPLPAAAQDRPLALLGAKLYPVSGAPIQDGALVVAKGRIVAVGPRASVSIPADAERRELAGLVLIPGLVDTHSHIGIGPRPGVPAHRDGNESSDPVTPQLRAIDAIWPADPGIRMARAGGLTTANIMPGSGNVVSGQTAYVKLRGESIERMRIRDAAGRPVLGGMKMANGENPKRAGKDRPPDTRMAVAQLERALFVEAQAYREKGKDRGRDLRLEPMLEVLDGKRIVHHHTHRADDIRTVLRIADEFGHRVVIQHGTEAYKVADELARRGVPVSAIVVDAPGGKLEAIELERKNPALLERAGVKVALHTDDGITESRFFLRSGALAVRAGMTEAGALRALTLTGAELLDLGGRIGSLEPGKDADFVVLSGEPFRLRTQVLETWIEGERVFDRADPRDRLYQTGGFAVADRYPPRAEAR